MLVPLLIDALMPLHPVLVRPDLVECSMNADGRIWIKLQGEAQMHMPQGVPVLAAQKMIEITELCAGAAGEKFDEDRILATGTFDFWIEGMSGGLRKFRFQAVRSPAVYGGPVAMSLRAFVTGDAQKDLRFERLRDLGKSLEEEIAENAQAILGMALDRDCDFDDVLAMLACERMNLVISGATDSGKTALTRRYISFIEPSERIITIEKGVELFPTQPNCLMLQSDLDPASQRNPTKLLQACLRLNPRRIILGELLGPEAQTFMEAINSGHEGSMSTIHASTARMAFEKLSSLIRQSGARIDHRELMENFRQSIHCVIQVMEDRRTGKRGIAEIWFPALENAALAKMA